MASLETEALILRSVDFGESDRILHLLVPDAGRLTAIAKGARRSVRRFAGTLDLFNHLHVRLDLRRPGQVSRLDQARLVRSFAPLRSDPSRFALGCYLLELLDRLAPEGAERVEGARLFAFALQTLDWVATRPASPQLRVLVLLRALDALGLRPELRNCVRCGREPAAREASRFHVAEGGPVCESCAATLAGLLPVQRGTLRALEQGARLDPAQLDRLVLPPRALAEAEQLLDRFSRFHLGVELASERFLRELIASGEAARSEA
ncbi:MAG TPA: DNA repair protein RecO [Myxococcota bacterium]|nr:DNA repair protein RecO [Myxococcota bacterium]